MLRTKLLEHCDILPLSWTVKKQKFTRNYEGNISGEEAFLFFLDLDKIGDFDFSSDFLAS